MQHHGRAALKRRVRSKTIRGFSPESPKEGVRKALYKNRNTPNKFPFGHNPIPASTPRDAESGQAE